MAVSHKHYIKQKERDSEYIVYDSIKIKSKASKTNLQSFKLGW